MKYQKIAIGIIFIISVLTGSGLTFAEDGAGSAAPGNAIVLFDGSDMDEWVKHAPKKWLVPDGVPQWNLSPEGYLEVVPESGSIISKRNFGDFKLHLEFRVMGEPINGGVYLQARYEINIKDSYESTEGAPCGALGNISKPEVLPEIENHALPPMQWQTFDIDFKAPRFDESGVKTESARITLVYNGELVYENFAVEEVKGAASRLGEAKKGPILLQEHGTAYQFRNIWIVENPAE